MVSGDFVTEPKVVHKYFHLTYSANYTKNTQKLSASMLVPRACVRLLNPHVRTLTPQSGCHVHRYTRSLRVSSERESEIDAQSDEGLKPEKTTGLVELKDVHFTYPARPDTQVSV